MMVSRKKRKDDELRDGFLLMELMVALVAMGIAIGVTLHLVNNIACLYTQGALATSLTCGVQISGEEAPDQRDRGEQCEIVACPLTYAEHNVAGNTIFSWIMQHVTAHKVNVRQRHDTRHTSLEMVIVEHDQKTSGFYAS